MNLLLRAFLRITLLAVALCGSIARAEHTGTTTGAGNEAWNLCHAQPPPPPSTPAGDGSARITADSAGGALNESVNFTGAARVVRGNQQLDANQVNYMAQKRHVTAHGAVTYQDPTLRVTGSDGDFWLDSGKSQLRNTEFWLFSRHARGSAAVSSREPPNHSRFERIRYTTCDSGNETWALNAREMSIDHAEGFGTAKDMWVEFMDVPIFYTPWASFPVDDRRKSGFLMPGFSQSKADGTTITAPWYWNIAPNHDATFTPRLITKRGLLLDTEYRYLTESSEGTVNFSTIPHDQIFGGHRERAALNHATHFAGQWQVDVTADRVSDKKYVEDLGTRIAGDSTKYLEQRVDLTYRDVRASGLLRAQTYQTLNDELTATQQPYKRLPQLLWDMDDQLTSGFLYNIHSEMVNFERDTGATGLRTDLQPQIGWRWDNRGYYIAPSVGYRYTQYRLNEPGSTSSNLLDRGMSEFSVDSGLIFDRPFEFRGSQFTQTLEPRAYYLNVPYRDQTMLPLFDTSERELNYSQLFRDNRFSSADRMSDADQLSLGLQTRVFNASGQQSLALGAGQIFYRQRPRVALVGIGMGNDDVSDWVISASAQPTTSFGLYNTWLLAPTTGEIDSARLQLHFTPGRHRVLNAGYSFQKQLRDQIELSASWPVGSHWQVLGRSHYALDEDKLLETLAGVEYQSCCWAVRVLTRKHRDSFDSTLKDNFMLQLELKGLTNLGSNIESVLERGILGYE